MRPNHYDYNEANGQTTFFVKSKSVNEVIVHLKAKGIYAGNLALHVEISEVIAAAKPEQIIAAFEDFNF